TSGVRGLISANDGPGPGRSSARESRTAVLRRQAVVARPEDLVEVGQVAESPSAGELGQRLARARGQFSCARLDAKRHDGLSEALSRALVQPVELAGREAGTPRTRSR